MPCRLLFDSRSTPVSGSIVKAILSFPETMLYLEGVIHFMFIIRVVFVVVFCFSWSGLKQKCCLS